MAVVHACLAQAFFLLTVALAVFTSPRWRSAPQKAESFNGLSLRWMSLLLAVAVYAQVILGAVLRHSGTVIGGPLHAHLAGAVVVGLCVVWVALRVFGYHAQDKSLTRPAGAVVLAFVLQLALGFGSLAARMAAADLHWPTGPEIWLTTAHLAVGALMLASSGMIMLQAFGRFPRAQAPASAPALTEQVT